MARDVGGAPFAPRAASGRWPLTGRSRELELLKVSIRERRGAVIAGPAGSGKSTLAQAGVDFAQDQGMSVALVAGSTAARPHAFGAFASMLPPGLIPVGPEAYADLLRSYTRELLEAAGGRPLLLFVDDAHLLDDGSTMLLHQLSLNGSAAVLACVLTSAAPGQPCADPTVVLWKDHDAERIELGPLGEADIEELLQGALDGPVDAASLRRIADHTRGDPLYLRELIIGALESHSLTDESGVWRLRGDLQPTSRLIDLVNLRLGHLSEAERHVLELATIGEPLALPVLDELSDRAAVEALEDRGFLTSRIDGRRLQMLPAHPVLSDVVRAGITPRRERELARALAEASGGRRQEDTLLLASLRLVGGGGNPELLLSGARAARARRDFGLTERLARAAVEQGEGFEARVLAAEAAHVQGRSMEAERELNALARDAGTPTEAIRVALLQFDLGFFARGIADVSSIDALLKTTVDPAWRNELLARRLCANGALHGPRAVLDSVTVPPEHAASTPSSVQAVVGGFLTRAGRVEEALGLLAPLPSDSGDSSDSGWVNNVAAEPWSPFANRALALIALGQLGEAEAFICAMRDSLSVAAGSPEAATVAWTLGAVHMMQGRVQSAFLHAASAAGTLLDLGRAVAARRCFALSATALALAGVAAKASEALVELDALGLPIDLSYECEVLQARAWVRAATGDVATARLHLEAAASVGNEVGDLLGATTALHGLARMGRARQVADQLGELAPRVDGELAAARLTYTLGAAARDSRTLEEAAVRFEAIGAHLHAAEALGESAVHLRRAGHVREAAACQQQAARLLAKCEGAVTPFVRSIGARAQLTPAELDTALQAASGNSDKQIAELMHLSVRTVENRLHRSYQKLGLSHRRELADALRDLPEAVGVDGTS